MKRVYIQLLLIVLVSVVVCAGAPMTVGAEQTVTYTVESVSVDGVLKEGETVTVRVGVMPTKALCMMEIVLKYDEELFEVVDGYVSPFVTSHYEMANVNTAPIDNQTGVPLAGTVLINAMSIKDTAVTAKTAVATVVLKARRDIHVSSDVTIAKMLAAYAPANPLDCAGVNGKITIKKGDVNGDGRLTVGDALKVFQAINGQLTLTQQQKEFADMNGDGALTLLDVTRLFYQVS